MKTATLSRPTNSIGITREYLSELAREASGFGPSAVHIPTLPGVEHVPVAGVATQLRRLVDPHITEKSKAWLIGYDCANLTVYTEWVELLERWLNVGASIDYLFLNPSPATVGAITGLKEKCKKADSEGRFKVFKIVDSKVTDEEGSQRMATWKTFHFAGFSNPRQLWVEKNHPVGKYFAENCTYYSENALDQDSKLYNLLQDKFRRTVNAYAEAF